MATQARIGIENQDGSVTYIYCHFDGYVNGVGKTLNLYYQEREKVEALIALGSISYLDKEVSLPEEEMAEHTFANPVRGCTLAYHRDRCESFIQSECGSTLGFFNLARSIRHGEYFYLYTIDNQWMLCQATEGRKKFFVQTLIDALDEE